MKLAVGFLLVLFITYLSTPSILSLIESTNDVTVYCTSIDDDQSDILKINLKSVPFLIFSAVDSKSCSEIYFRSILKHSSLSDSIFIPPPEQV